MRRNDEIVIGVTKQIKIGVKSLYRKLFSLQLDDCTDIPDDNQLCGLLDG